MFTVVKGFRSKALLPIEVTELGISIEVKLLFQNTPSLMTVKRFGMLIEVTQF